MIPAPFEYRSPETIEEALALLSRYREDARILTGGQSLLGVLKLRLATPAVLVDLRRVRGLSAIEPSREGTREGFVIGALVTHREVEASPLVRARSPLLADVAGRIGDVQIRNVGTLVGSIVHADPSSDYPAALLVLGARVAVASPRGEWEVPVADFLQGAFEAALEPDELVRSVEVPASFPSSAAYVKMRLREAGFALSGVAAQLTLDGPRARAIAVGVTGAAARPFRATAVEDALRGRDITREAVRAAVRGITEGHEILADSHASLEYRAHLAEVHAERAILRAAAVS